MRGCDEYGNPLDPNHPWNTDTRTPAEARADAVARYNRKVKAPTMSEAVSRLLESSEREAATASFRRHNGSPVTADAITADILIPLRDWIENEFQRLGEHHEGTELALAVCRLGGDLVELWQKGQVAPEPRIDLFSSALDRWAARLGESSALMAQTAAQRAVQNGTKGGKHCKRPKWAEYAAEQIASAPNKEAAWNRIPTPQNAWEYETNAESLVIYRDNVEGDDRIVCADPVTKKEWSRAKSSFLKRYYKKPARRKLDSNPP